jgi:ATPase subunit of ABC transporter with duplicated ATPase domains
MSSMLLDAQQVTLGYAERTVLDAVDVTVGVDSRVGLVGPNGAHYRGGWTAYVCERDTARDRARAEHEQATKRQEQLIAAGRETRRRAAASLNRARARVHDNDKSSREWVTMRAEEMTGRARKMRGQAERRDALSRRTHPRRADRSRASARHLPAPR